MPLLSGAQWLIGTSVALVMARRSRAYGDSGAAPRALARLAFLVFLIAGISVLVSLIAERRSGGALHPDYATAAWRMRTIGILSVVAWVLTVCAAIWNTVLGVSLRRRTAIQELKRRTDRVRDYRTPPAAPRG